MDLGTGKAGALPRALLAFLLSTFIGTAFLHAFPGKIELSGIVLDPSGHSVAGASITVVNPIKGISRKVMSDPSGRYRFPDLPVGIYHLKVAYPGFALYSQDVTLDETGTRSLEVTLRIATRKETVTITSSVAGRLFSAGRNSSAV